jgi:hypothetical protein
MGGRLASAGPPKTIASPKIFAQKKFPAGRAHCADEETGANYAQLQLFSTPMPDTFDQPQRIERRKRLPHGTNQYSGGGAQKVESTSSKNTKEHWMGRLDRDRPDLAAKVDAGEMTAYAAAIAAGIRKKPVRSNQPRRRRFDAAAMIG